MKLHIMLLAGLLAVVCLQACDSKDEKQQRSEAQRREQEQAQAQELARQEAERATKASIDAIQRVLVQYAKIDTDSWAKAGTGKQAPALEASVGQMNSIDRSGCPADFIAAYAEVVQSWDKLVVQLYSEPQSNLAGMVLEFKKGLQWEDAADEAVAGRNAIIFDIRNKWQSLETISLVHGAKLPWARN
jgi:type II secretory pathway pseudopilin PulG